MRTALKEMAGKVPDHVGLAYDAWAPVGEDGKVPEVQKLDWLGRLSRLRVSPDYQHAFRRWRESFLAPGDRVFELALKSRLLVGHGNSSATDVGLTVHHTWGVPMISGSALKGLTAHYLDAVYGPDHPAEMPWEQADGEERERTRYQGSTWRGRRIYRGPGDVYRALFGAPEAETDPLLRQHGLKAGAAKGLVEFHDALYVPGSAPDDQPYAVDVLTVHNVEYYRSAGKHRWPNDYESPNPLNFLTVRPGVRMLIALSGPQDWTELAARLLRRALERWGIGGKTSAGYGRLVSPEPSAGTYGASEAARLRAAPLVPEPGERVEVVLLAERTKKGGWKARHEPSGLAGPIQNSSDVPPEMMPGHRIHLIVASVNPREMAFRYVPPEATLFTGRRSD